MAILSVGPFVAPGSRAPRLLGFCLKTSGFNESRELGVGYLEKVYRVFRQVDLVRRLLIVRPSL